MTVVFNRWFNIFSRSKVSRSQTALATVRIHVVGTGKSNRVSGLAAHKG
jgi:hypothetical protein